MKHKAGGNSIGNSGRQLNYAKVVNIDANGRNGRPFLREVDKKNATYRPELWRRFFVQVA